MFRGWGKKSAIFHDPKLPERVYSVVDTGDGCGRSVSKKIKNERKRLKSALYNVALKIESGETITKKEEIHLAGLFPQKNVKTIRNASERIRCQSGVRDSFLAGLERFNRYSYLVDTVLKQYDLPNEIRYLPFVESSYNPAAYSKAGAAGMWQIMPRTARVLGLELDATIDERLDPEAATHGAARYLVKSRNSLGELARSIDPGITDQEINPFIITSYNFGLTGMRRAISTVEPNYLSVLEKYKSPSFQIAVKNFYTSFLAARHVALNAHKYFGEFYPAKKLEYQTVVLDHSTSIDRIKSVFKIDEEELKPLNLGLTRFIWHSWRMVPAGYQLKLPKREDQYAASISKLKSLAPETVAPGSEDYIVRKGDTACGIARALKVNCRELINVNRLGKRALIIIGQKLAIPRKLTVVASSASKGPDKPKIVKSGQQSEKIYKVRRGDSACKIASRFAVSCRTLISVNQLGRKATIYVGQKLVIPGLISDRAKATTLDENNQYLVQKGDFACSIAARFSVNCAELKRINELNKKATIYPGQKLKIPGLVVPNTTETAEQLAEVDKSIAQINQPDTNTQGSSDATVQNESLSNLLDTLPDLSISISESGGNPVYRIWIEADETLGHYSDWLGMGSTKTLRSLNKITSDKSLRIGQLLKLPVESADMVSRFEQKRMEYHQVLSESLKEHYDLVGIEKYRVLSGDSVWSLSNSSGFPVWLLYRLNPKLKLANLRVGQEIILPKLKSKEA